MMKEKGKPEAEQARYRNMLHSLSAKVLVLETAAKAGEVQAQARLEHEGTCACVRSRLCYSSVIVYLVVLMAWHSMDTIVDNGSH